VAIGVRLGVEGDVVVRDAELRDGFVELLHPLGEGVLRPQLLCADDLQRSLEIRSDLMGSVSFMNFLSRRGFLSSPGAGWLPGGGATTQVLAERRE